MAANIDDQDEAPGTSVTRLHPQLLRAETVDRSRLTDQLIAPTTRIVVVSGPAGSGKSVLLSQAHAASTAVAWLSMDRVDNDPTVFWTAVIDAIAEVISGFGQAYRHRLANPGAAVVDRVVPLLVNELTERRKPLQLFIDDIHLLTSPASLRSLDRFIERCPEGVTFVLAGRGMPKRLPLSRWRLHGDVSEIGSEELATQPDEAMSLLLAMDVDIGRAQLDTLLERTEGWVAGMHWAGMTLRSAPDVDAFLHALVAIDGEIASYLVGEVLDRISPEERYFMLETSVLDFMSPALCDAVRGRNDSGRILDHLLELNAFVIPIDPIRGRYRYHHLARDVLVARLERERPDLVADLHRRASLWLSTDGAYVPEAVRHARAAGDLTRSADILCGNWWELISQGLVETLRTLFGLFDPDEIRAYQPLAIAAAEFYCSTGDRELGRPFYEAAEFGDFDGAPPDGSAEIKSTLAIMRAALVFEGVDQSMADAEIAYSLEPVGSTWRPTAAMFLGLAHTWRGEIEEAAPYFEEVLAFIPPNDPWIVYALGEISIAHLERGDVPAAVDSAVAACARAEEAGIETYLVAAPAYAAKALANLAAGNAHESENALHAAEEPLASVDSTPIDAMRTRILLADAALQLGLLNKARTWLHGAKQVDHEIADTGILSDQLAAVQARLDEALTEANSRPDLTDRERQVLALLPTELTTREIGDQLFLGRNTIHTYQQRIYSKLGVSSRSDAVAAARRAGFLDAE
ncbi:MAG: LuxR C-terminal-related transcriptional regulator [Acidimicrobiales bacterium]